MSTLKIKKNVTIEDTGYTLEELVATVKSLKTDNTNNKTNITNLSNSIVTITQNIATINGELYKTGVGCPNNNMNEAVVDGCYFWAPEISNRPNSNYGTVFVTNSSTRQHNWQSNWCNQLAFGTDMCIYFRQKINAGGWTSWVRLH